MRCLTLPARTRFWGTLLLAAALAGFGLAWLALVGSGEGASTRPEGLRLTGRQVPVLVQPFSPQRLVGELAPNDPDRAMQP